MIASLVITLREGIEAALVVGIVLAYLTKVGRGHLKRIVYLGLAAAVAASILLAAVFQLVGLKPDNPYVEVLWMRKAARGLKAKMETRLENITSGDQGKAIGWGLFGFTFVMVLREGVETVLFLKAAALGNDASVTAFAGAFIGVGLAVLFAVLFIRGSVRINLPRFFRYTSLALLVLGAKLLLGSVHEFSEVGLFPAGNEFIFKVSAVATGTPGTIVTSVAIAVPVLLLLWEISGGARRRLGRRMGHPAAGTS
jgi:high-affinity iron transporter